MTTEHSEAVESAAAVPPMTEAEAEHQSNIEVVTVSLIGYVRDAAHAVHVAEQRHDELCTDLYAPQFAEAGRSGDSPIRHQLRAARHALAAAEALIAEALR